VIGDLLVRRREGLIHAEVDDELVALHIDNGACYGFNPTATRIWMMLETPRLFSQLKDMLLTEYDVESEACASQLADLLKELEQDGLVELQPVPNRA
jgi:hypothetical protein